MMLRRMSSSREVTWAGTSGEEGRTLSWELGGLCCAGEGGAGEPEELAASEERGEDEAATCWGGCRGEERAGRGRWRPGHHVRLRERRDGGLHAAHAPHRNAAREEAHGRAQERSPLVAPAGREDAGDGGVQAEEGRLGGAAQ